MKRQGEKGRTLVTDDRDKGFEDLYERYYRPVCLFFLRMGFQSDSVQDLAQEVFLRVYEHVESYRGEAQWSYLEQTARRLAFNRIRDQRASKRSGSVVEIDQDRRTEDSIRSSDDPAGELLEREQAQRLRAAVDDLAPGMKAVVLLYLDGSSYDEIAKVTGVSAAAVKSRLRDARRALRSKLGFDDGS